MIRTTTLIVSVAAATAALTWTLAAPASTPSPQATKHMGRTAQQWHRIALERLKARDWYHSRLGDQIRESRKLIQVVRHLSAQDTVLTSPLERDFLCIHSYEGSWTDPNAPFYGGLQMDDGFQKAYGREFYDAWGSADHWPASVQIAVAMKAYLSGRGFGPWPNTARYCGLR